MGQYKFFTRYDIDIIFKLKISNTDNIGDIFNFLVYVHYDHFAPSFETVWAKKAMMST